MKRKPFRDSGDLPIPKEMSLLQILLIGVAAYLGVAMLLAIFLIGVVAKEKLERGPRPE